MMITDINQFRKINEKITLFPDYVSEDVKIFQYNIKRYIECGMNIPALQKSKLLQDLIILDTRDGVILDFSKLTHKDFYDIGVLLHYKMSKCGPPDYNLNDAIIKQLFQTIEKSFKKSHNYVYNKLSDNIDFKDNTFTIKMKNDA